MHLVPSLDESLLVEQTVCREKVLAVNVDHFRGASSQPDVRGAVVQRIAPPLVEADRDVDWTGRIGRREICGLQVARELTRSNGEVANGTLDEVAGDGRFGKLYDLWSRLEGVDSGEQIAHAGDVRRVVALARPHLYDREIQRAHMPERCHPLDAHGMPAG